MAHAVDSRSENPANALRDALAEAETLVVAVNAENVESFLVLLDTIEQALDELSQQEALDIRPEQGRWESLLRRIASSPGAIASAAARAGGYAALRAKHPPAESFWWYLDEEVNKRRWKLLRRTAITLVTIVVVVFGGVWLVDTLFPPDPDTLVMVESQAQIDERIFQQDWDGALEIVGETRQRLPTEPELMIWEAVLAEQAGDTVRAEAALTEAQAALADQPEMFWVTTGNYRIMVGDNEGAEAAANAALEINPESAMAVFILANAADNRGERIAAIDLFEEVFLLAEDDNPQLAVIAKVRMGQLMQQFDPFESTAEEDVEEDVEEDGTSAADAQATPTADP